MRLAMRLVGDVARPAPIDQAGSASLPYVPAVVSNFQSDCAHAPLSVGTCSIDGFEYTRELDAFDVLNIPLRHGWLVDPEERGTV